MILITHDNYEAYLLGRLDGTLTADEQRDLDIFLLANPELDDDAIELPIVDASGAMNVHDKQALKRSLPSEEVYFITLDDLLVGKLEGDLSEEQERQLNLRIEQDEQVGLAWRIMRATRVQATTVLFPNKVGLKRERNRVIPLYRALAVAASIALLVGLVWFYNIDAGQQQHATVTTLDKVDSVAAVGEAQAPVSESSEQDQQQRETGQVVAAPIPTISPERNANRQHPAPHEVNALVAITVPNAPATDSLERETLASLAVRQPTLKSNERIRSIEFADRAMAIAPNSEQAQGNRASEPWKAYLGNKILTAVLKTPDATVQRVTEQDTWATVGQGLQQVAGGAASITIANDERRLWALRIGKWGVEANLRN